MKLVLFANTDWYLYNFRRSLVVALCKAGHEVVLISPSGVFAGKLEELGFRWIAAPMNRRSLNPIRELFLLHWLWRVMRRERPDIVHGFTIKCAVYGSLAARLTGAGRVSAVAGMGYVFTSNALKARLLRPLVRFLMRAVFGGTRTRIILQNPDDVKLFRKARIIGVDQLRLIRGSGVDCSAFTPPIPQIDDTEPLRVLMAGRLLWDKGLAEYIEAARLLRAEGRNLQFILAGAPDPGNPASVPEEKIITWQAEGLVAWRGHVLDMPALFANADIVVLPSYREGLPKSLIEAAACARPLITTDVPGCREVVTDFVDGLLIPVRDAPALARAIARLQDDPALARRLGEAARRKALAEFDEQIVIARTLAVYDEVAA